MKLKLALFVLLSVTAANAQNWSTFIDPSRAIDWSGAGFTIPSYTTNCATQPTLTPSSSGAASANTTAIQNALNSCDATHNVVNIPPGSYYFNGWNYKGQGKQVVRGAGPMSTTILPTDQMFMSDPNGTYSNGDPVLTGGSNQCLWTAGYSKGTTTITLSSCGGTPPVGKMIILDQANEASDTGGIYLCDNVTVGCTVESRSSPRSGNPDGRVISNVTHSLQQVVIATGVTSLGGGGYTVTISPGVYFTNIRSGQSPGVYWAGFVQNDGIENLTIDHSQSGNVTAVNMFNCYQCWVKNVRSINAERDHVWINLGLDDVVRDSYFYGAQSSGSQSYAVELEESSGVLVENNIFQQVTNPLMFGQSTGTVVGYNYSIDDIYSGGAGQFVQAAYAGHNAGNTMNLWEGNNFVGIWSDANWGSSFAQTLFRNMLIGWQSGKTANTTPILFETFSRGFNVAGNVLGEPGYNTNYQSYATSTTAGVNQSLVETSIYGFGWTGSGGSGTCQSPPTCDALIFPTTMRWGNWDTASNAIRWDATEASPASIPYLSANFSSSYFSSLAHTLPASLYYSSRPSWWPSGKNWPPVGPDVTTGNVGYCTSGTYAKSQAVTSGQCVTGGLTAAWASHTTSIPAQDCYLRTMLGPPDGTGSVLSFDPSTCYTSGTLTSTTTTLSAASLSPIAGVNDLLTTTVTSSSATGTVTFADNGSNIGSCTLSSGSCTFNVIGIAAGVHPYTATYGGDSTFATSGSATVTVTATNPVLPAPRSFSGKMVLQ